MLLLTIANNRLEISPYALTINEFKDIWDRDSSKEKDRAVKELSFIYFMADYKSNYRAYDSSSRLLAITNDIELKDWTPDDLIVKAIKKYEELQITPSIKFLKNAEQSLNKISSFITAYVPSDDETGAKFKAIIAGVKALPDLLKSINNLTEMAEKELSDTKRVRGGHSVGARERPKSQ